MAGRLSAPRLHAEATAQPNRPTQLARLKAIVVALCMAALADMRQVLAAMGGAYRAERARWAHPDAEAGILSFGGLFAIVGIIVGSIVGAVVGMVLLNALAPVYFNNLKGLIANLTAINLDNGGIGDTFIVITVLIISIAGPLAFMGLAIAAIVIKVKGGGKGVSS